MEVTRAVNRQRADADAAALDRNLGPVTHITDEGQSASRFATRKRDGWPVLLDAIWAGRVSYVLVWLLDRAVRQTRDLDDLLDACRETGTLILQTGTGTIIDADNPDSVAMAKIQGALAEAEVAKMSKRVRRAHAEKARLGQFHGGKRRWGYNADMSELHPVEAPLIRKIAAEIIAGRTLHNVARELTRNGTPGPMWKGVPFRMGEWTGSNLGTLLRREYLMGKRLHKDAVTDAAWPAILDAGTWETLQAVLNAPTRRTNPIDAPGNGTARKHLLSGLITCAECGKPLRSKTSRYGHIYACPDLHVSRSMPLVDARVIGSVVRTLSRPDFAAVWLAEPESADRGMLEARIGEIEARLADWTEREMTGRALPAQVARATEIGMAEIADIRARLSTMAAAAAIPAVLDGLAGNPDAAAAWDALDDLDRRRAIVAAMADIRLHKAARRGAPFDPASVEITWRLGG